MFMLQTTPKEQLTGKAAEVFARFPAQVGVPEPLQLLSASPGLVGVMSASMEYYAGHPDLGFELLAAIRLLASRVVDGPACIRFNSGLLRAAGLEESELAALPEGGGAFSQAERALLGFVVRALREPASVGAAELDALRALGWQDAAILDAMHQAAFMQVPALLLKVFQR